MSRDAYRLYRDKKIRGVYWPSRFFFASWGIWNLKYYTGLEQKTSLWGGIALVTVNLIWCALALKYKDA